jgi:hypothetical protein
MVKLYDVTVSTDLAMRICEQFGVDIDRCASITVELLPAEPIRVKLTLLAGEEFERIDWEGYLATAQMVQAE